MGCGASDDTIKENDEDYDSEVEWEEGMGYDRRELDEGTGLPVSNTGE